MEETLPKFKKESKPQYSIMDESEEDIGEERLPKTPLSLSRALTSPDSVAMSECATESLLDHPEIPEEVWLKKYQTTSSMLALAACTTFLRSLLMPLSAIWAYSIPFGFRRYCTMRRMFGLRSVPAANPFTGLLSNLLRLCRIMQGAYT